MGSYVLFLEFNNFKSFRHTKFGPLLPRTLYAIHGSNGAGKSNVVDGIAFVCGEGDLEKLRVSTLKEFLFSSGNARAESCSVTAEFCILEDRKQFSREINDERDEVFKIDNEIVDRFYYCEQLRTVSIDTNFPNLIVHYGSMNCMVEQTPRQMTEFFEKVSGSADFRREYESLEEKVKITLGKVTDSNTEVDYIKVCKKRSTAHLHHTTLKKQLETVQSKWVFLTLYHFPRHLDITKNKIMGLRDRCDQSQKELQVLRSKLCEMRDEEMTLLEVASDLDSLLKISELEQNKISKNLSEMTVLLSQDLKRNKFLAEGVEKEISLFKLARSKFEEELSKIKEELVALTETTIDCSCYVFSEFDTIPEDDRAELSEAYSAFKEIDKNFYLEQKLFKRTEAINFAHAHLEFLQNQQKQLHHQIPLKQEQLQSLRLHRLQIQQQISELEQDLYEGGDTVEKVLDDLNEINRHLLFMEAIKEVDYSRRIVQILQEQEDISKYGGHVVGLLGDLLDKFEGEYAGVLNKALHENFQSIVVDSLETALMCRNFLVSKKHETQTFLWHPKEEINEDELTHDLIGQRLSAVFKEEKCADTKYVEELVLHLTKDIMICENEVEAEADYEVVFVNEGLREELPFYEEYDAEHVAELELEKEILVSKLKSSSRLREEQTSQAELNIKHKIGIEDLKERLKETEGKIKGVGDNVGVEKELDDAKKAIEENERKIFEVTEDLSTLERERSEIKSHLEAIQDEFIYYKKFCEGKNIANLRQYIGPCNRCCKMHEEKKLDLKSEMTFLESNLDRLTLDIEKAQGEQSRRQDRIDQLEQTKSAAEQELSNYTRDTEDLYREKNANMRKLDDCRRNMLKVEQEISDLEKMKASLYAEELLLFEFECALRSNLKLANNIRRILRSADDPEVDNSDSPFDDSYPDNSQVSSIASVSTQSVPQDEFDVLPDNLKDLTEWDEVQAVGKKLLELETALRNEIGISLSQIRDEVMPYNQVDEALANASQKLTKVLSKLKRVQEDLKQVRIKRNDLFMECYDTVSNAIKKMYKDLTDSNAAVARFLSRWTVGEHEAFRDDFVLICKAPGKPPLPLDGLSSGERAMLGVAFVLAFDEYKKTPFLALDEIDAEIDMPNVNRVVRALKDRAKSSQVFAISHRFSFQKESDVLVRIQKNGSVRYLDLRRYRMVRR